jgi:hypothetical protein
MSRPRVVLMETEAVLHSILLRFFELEDIEASACASPADVQQLITHDPVRVVVAEPWTNSAGAELSSESRDAIEELGRMAAGLILTTGRAWAVNPKISFSSRVIVVPKPYDLDDLANAIRVMWARAARRGRMTPCRHVASVTRMTCSNRHRRTPPRRPMSS